MVVGKIYNNIKYVMTGNLNQLDEDCYNLILDNNLLDNIIFTGRLDVRKSKYYYADSDIVLSVPFSDSSPFSVYEAMASGTNVIVSDLEWVKNKFENNKHLVT